MREIKFRVYDKATNEMYFVGNLAQLTFGLENQEWSLWSPEGMICDDEDTILMQYTGLKDKNGKEIYEGDIVNREVLAFGEIRTFTGQVKFFECAWWIDTETAAVPLWDEIHELEVIGNIYENLDLLGESE